MEASLARTGRRSNRQRATGTHLAGKVSEALARGSRSWWLLGLATTLAVTLPAWLPWIDPRQNLWEVDDAKNHMLRIYVLGWLLEHGVYYPRWVPDLFMGYGYPVFNYYAPAFYYLAWLLGRLLRLDVWDAYRAAGVTAVLLGASGSYALVTTLWRRASLGVLAALTVIYGPYVFQLNLYKRGDIPEVLGLALIPWLLLALWRLWLASTPRQAVAWMGLAVAVGAAEILVHNLTALVAAVVATVWVAYLLFVWPAMDSLLRVVIAGTLAVGLCAFFWLPAIGEGHAVHLEELSATGDLDYRGWFIEPGGNAPRQQAPDNRQTRTGLFDLHVHYPHQLVAPPKLSLAQGALGALATLSLGVSIARAGYGVISGRATPRRKQWSTARGQGQRQESTERPDKGDASPPTRPAGSAALAPLLVIAGGCWFLTFAASGPVWSRVPGLPLLQFPWRLLGPLGVCLAVAGAGALAGPLAYVEGRWRDWGRMLGGGLVVLIAGAVLLNSLGGREFQFADQPARVIDGRAVVADEERDVRGWGTTSNKEFLPREVHLATYTAGLPRGRPVFERLYPEQDWLDSLLYPLAGDLRFLGWRSDPHKVSVRVANDGGQTGLLAVHQARFLGWRAWLDGERTPVGTAPFIPEQQASLGFMVVAVPPGEHTVSLAFGPTPLRAAGMGVSLVSALSAAGAGLWLLWPRRRWSRVILLIGWLLLAIGSTYLVWRGLRPALAGWAILPVPTASSCPGGARQLQGSAATSRPVSEPQQCFEGSQPVDGVWQAPDLATRGAGLLVNVAEAVRTGQARVQSPTGPALGKDLYVDVRQLDVTDEDQERGAAGTSRRQWLYLHPPSAVSVDLALPPQREVWLQAALTLDPAMWAAPLGDGVRFQALVSRLSAAGQEETPAVVLDSWINPRAKGEHRRWVPVDANLTPWSGQRVRLTLRTLGGDNPHFDWGGWGNPVVIVRESARVRQSRE